MTTKFADDPSAHFSLGGVPSTRLASAGAMRLPLVSFIVRNWNYADYVGATLDSIKAQDYPRFEAIIVDNGSTDASCDIIQKHVGDDPRFTIIHSETNLGPMGGVLRGLEAAHGEFVVFVDSDDTLLPNFASAHIQVHLATRLNVAFTSCTALETGSDGTLVNGHRKRTMIEKSTRAMDLRPAQLVPRLSAIDADSYEALTRSTTILDPSLSTWHWPWSPGTSNMYRRFMIDLVAPVSEDPDIRRRLAADGHYNRLCHLLGGSAIIDMPLATYRIHGQNFHVSVPSLHNMNTDGGPAAKFAAMRIQEIIRVLTTHASDLSWRIGSKRFWDALAMLLQYPQHTETSDFTADPSAFLAEQLPLLIAAFGEKDVIRQLSERIPSRLLARALARHHGGAMPLSMRLRIQLLRFRRLKGRVRQQLRKRRNP